MKSGRKPTRKPSFEQRVESAYEWAVGIWREPQKREVRLRHEYGPHASEAIAILEEAAESMNVEDDEPLVPPEGLYAWRPAWLLKFPEHVTIRRDSFLSSLVPEDERWKRDGWRCRCGSSKAIFMDTCTKRPDSHKVWCAHCVKFVGLVSEADFIFALDHQGGREVLEYSEVSDLKDQVRMTGRSPKWDWKLHLEEYAEIDRAMEAIDSKFPNLEADEPQSDSSSK